MNLIQELNEISIESPFVDDPFLFVVFKEVLLKLDTEYIPEQYFNYARSIFSKSSLNGYFENKITFEEMLKSKNTSELDDKSKEVLFDLFDLVEERLEKIKQMDRPTLDERQLKVFKAIVDSPNNYISTPYLKPFLRGTLHKNELLTLLLLTEWKSGFQSTIGPESSTVLSISIDSIFRGMNNYNALEIYLPYNEIKALADQFSDLLSEDFQKDLAWTKYYSDIQQNALKNNYDKQVDINNTKTSKEVF